MNTSTDATNNTSDAALETRAQTEVAAAAAAGEADKATFWFTIGLLVKQVPMLARALVEGPQRANRTRGLDIFIRFFRESSKSPDMNVYRARSILGALDKLGETRKKVALKGATFTPRTWTATLDASAAAAAPAATDAAGAPLPVVALRSSLAAKYPLRTPSTWQVSAEWTVNNEATYDPDRVVMYLHGGAYCFSSAASYRHFVGPLAKRLGRRVFNVEYRLAPESVFPDALHDAVSAFLYLTEVEGIAPRNIVFMGDSAGANLAMVTMLFLRDHGYPLPGGAALLSPWSDLAHNLPSYFENAKYDYINPFDESPNMNPVALLCGRRDYHDVVKSEPLLSPVLDSQTAPQLPPIYISTGSDEILLDENVLLAAGLAKRGASVLVHDVHEHQIHVHPFLAPFSNDAARFRSRLHQFITQVADAPAGTFPAPLVEVAYFKDGELVEAGPGRAWAPRWAGIRNVKALDWDAAEIATSAVLPAPEPLDAETKAAASNAVDSEAALAEGVTRAAATSA
ncbi:hypothetical protein H9P43_001112 [Blastocladiella emersonii ATCC 22665]|nr:hypothetical protein H9P43_001112 [Blastocladiella emersonii ATCC 22665]